MTINARAIQDLYDRLCQTLENSIEEWDLSQQEVVVVLDLIKSEMNESTLIILSDNEGDEEDYEDLVEED